MTTRRVVVSMLLVLLAALVFAPSARADSQARIVRLSLVDGSVQEATTTTPDSSAWEAPHLAAPAGKP